MFWKTVTQANSYYYFFCPTLLFYRLEKIFYTFTWEQGEIYL